MHEQTLAIHAGYEKDAQGTMAVPIYQSTAYEFRDTELAENLFSLKELGNIYTRLMNPTTDVFEKRFAALEGGVAAIGTASGMAAIFYAIANVAEAGDNVIVAKQVYGGTTTLTGHTIKRFGIETRYFDVRNPSELEALIDDRTKIIIFESITNPSIDVADIDTIHNVGFGSRPIRYGYHVPCLQVALPHAKAKVAMAVSRLRVGIHNASAIFDG